MSKRDRRDDRGRDRDRDRDRDRRDSQPDDEGQRRSGEVDMQESESLTALKAILSKVASLLNPLQLNQDESIRLVEQLYGGVLAMDVLLAGEADDTRKQSVLAHIQNTTITRQDGKIVVDYPSPKKVAPEPAPAQTPDETPREAPTGTPTMALGMTPTISLGTTPDTAPSEARPVEEVAADAPAAPKPRSAGARRSAPRRKPAGEAKPATVEPQEPTITQPAWLEPGSPDD